MTNTEPRTTEAILRWVRRILPVLFVVVPPCIVLLPWFERRDTFGFHDWDVQTAHRYLVVTSLLDHGELPAWDPFACGGFPAWGYVEGATNLVSPWLPFYLLGDIRFALRIEVLGMGILGAWGAYLAAGHFTRSIAMRGFVVAVFAVNGRFALQAASGHTWHLCYALLPWCFHFFEKARLPEGRARDEIGAQVAFALLVYWGGIYPLPHAALFVGLYAAGMAITTRALRPLWVFARVGAGAVLLAAPKLFPLIALFRRAPRTIASDEVLDLGSFFTLLTSRAQAFYDRPAAVSPYGWHEWGMYIGWGGVFVLGAAMLFASGKRENVLRVIALFFGLCGFGKLFAEAPWPLLHKYLPVFSSQHVPSRFLYPAVFILALAACAWIGKRVEAARPWVDPALAAVVLAYAVDVAIIAQKPMRDAMWMELPDRIPRGETFSHSRDPSVLYKRLDWAGPQYPPMLANTGVIRCYGTPPFDERGAIARRDPAYRGEAYVLPHGAATVSAWSPNAATVDLSGVEGPSQLVYNMNYDEGFGATVTVGGETRGATVRSVEHRVVVDLPAGAERARIVYRPPGLGLGVFGVVLYVAVMLLRRRLDARKQVS